MPAALAPVRSIQGDLVSAGYALHFAAHSYFSSCLMNWLNVDLMEGYFRFTKK